MPSGRVIAAAVVAVVLLVLVHEWWEYKKCTSGHYTCIVRR